MTPGAKWKSIKKRGMSHETCLQAAERAMKNHGFKIHDRSTDDDYIVVGSGGDVVAMVVCVPALNDTAVVVAAFETGGNEVAGEVLDHIVDNL